MQNITTQDSKANEKAVKKHKKAAFCKNPTIFQKRCFNFYKNTAKGVQRSGSRAYTHAL